jgi:hypothetical protein
VCSCFIDIVAYRPVAKLPFLGNASVNTFPSVVSKFLIMQQLYRNNGNGVFMRGPSRDITRISKGPCWNSLVEFCAGGCEEKS